MVEEQVHLQETFQDADMLGEGAEEKKKGSELRKDEVRDPVQKERKDQGLFLQKESEDIKEEYGNKEGEEKNIEKIGKEDIRKLQEKLDTLKEGEEY